MGESFTEAALEYPRGVCYPQAMDPAASASSRPRGASRSTCHGASALTSEASGNTEIGGAEIEEAQPPQPVAGGLAAGVDPAIQEANLKRLRRVEGQVRGVQRMVEEGRYCADVLIQIASIQEALRGVSREVMRNHLAHCAAEAQAAGGDAADAMHGELVDLIFKYLR
jgi:CsoR family transcriptional regulator, copper-sensing transcriptional repressor